MPAVICGVALAAFVGGALLAALTVWLVMWRQRDKCCVCICEEPAPPLPPPQTPQTRVAGALTNTPIPILPPEQPGINCTAGFTVVASRTDPTHVACLPFDAVAFFNTGAGITYWIPASQAASVPGAVPSTLTNAIYAASTSYVLTAEPLIVDGDASISTANGSLMLLFSLAGFNLLSDTQMP